MNFDFKITIWERINVPECDEQTILDKFKSGEFDCSQDVYDYYDKLYGDDDTLDPIDPVREILYDTEESMTPEDNNGYSTIEILADNGNLLYSNRTLKN